MFEVGLSRHVASYPLLSGFAGLLQRQEKPAEAAQVLCSCLRLFSSQVPTVLSRLAYCMYAAGHPQKAATLYKRVRRVSLSSCSKKCMYTACIAACGERSSLYGNRHGAHKGVLHNAGTAASSKAPPRAHQREFQHHQHELQR